MLTVESPRNSVFKNTQTRFRKARFRYMGKHTCVFSNNPGATMPFYKPHDQGIVFLRDEEFTEHNQPESINLDGCT